MTRCFRALFIAALLLTPLTVSAHSPIEGVDSFYAGLLHPVFVPSHLLLLIALGLFLGQRGLEQNGMAIGAFLVTSIAGLLAAWFTVGYSEQIVLISGSAVLGALVAASLAVGRFGVRLLQPLQVY